MKLKNKKRAYTVPAFDVGILTGLMLTFITSAIDSTGRLPVLGFILSCCAMIFLTNSLTNLFFLSVAIYINSFLVEGSLFGISTRMILFVIVLLTILQYILFYKTIAIQGTTIPIWLYVLMFMYMACNLIIKSHGTITSICVLALPIGIGFTLEMLSSVNVEFQEKCIRTLFWGFFFIAIIGCIEEIIGHTFFFSRWRVAYRNGMLRIGSTMNDSNNVAFMLVPFYFMLKMEVFRKYFSLKTIQISKIITLLAILFTSSRTGWLALVAGLFFEFFAYRKKLSILLLPGLLFLVNVCIDLVEHNIATQYVESGNYRHFIIGEALLMWSGNKWFGTGISPLFAELQKSNASQIVINTMNTYVFFLAGYGMSGLLIFIIYIWKLTCKDIVSWFHMSSVSQESIHRITVIMCVLIIAYTLDVFYMGMLWILPSLFDVGDANKVLLDQI